jgi:hypothetical protein
MTHRGMRCIDLVAPNDEIVSSNYVAYELNIMSNKDFVEGLIYVFQTHQCL